MMTKAALKGTEKQIAWAEDIRSKIESEYEDCINSYVDEILKREYFRESEEFFDLFKAILKKSAENLLRDETSAKVYIENRTGVVGFFIERALDYIKSDSTEGASEAFIKQFARYEELGHGKYKIIKCNEKHFIISFKNRSLIFESADIVTESGRLRFGLKREYRIPILKEILKRM